LPNIKIEDVRVETITKGRNSYQQALVIHTNDRGEKKEKKVMSFSNPAVFAIASNAKAGEQYVVEYTPGDQFYAWASMNKTGDEEVVKKDRAASTPVRTTYETADERAENRVRIVRQSCLGYAIGIMTPGAGGKQLNLDEVKIQAQELVDWVYRDDLAEDDIPF
jgi:hypothetical protein